jgi:hypothetical protein
MYIAGLRFSNLLNSNQYVVDFNTRYPLWNNLSLNPRPRPSLR